MHNRETFKFEVEGKLINVESVKYTFESEEIFEKFIGKENIDKYRDSNKLEVNLGLKAIAEYYPQLLEGEGVKSINWKEQEYDELLRVVCFFLNYKKNAWLRQLESETSTMSSIIGQAKEAMDLIRNFGLKKHQ